MEEVLCLVPHVSTQSHMNLMTTAMCCSCVPGWLVDGGGGLPLLQRILGSTVCSASVAREVGVAREGGVEAPGWLVLSVVGGPPQLVH